eukprot:COSAG02_NODE_18843_length_914_cov_12.923001_3_plen_43_part_01
MLDQVLDELEEQQAKAAGWAAATINARPEVAANSPSGGTYVPT